MQDRATWHDFQPGTVQQTGNPLDVAIDGDAFLVVQTPRGERYTRNGALQINAAGELVTAEGYPGAGRRRADPVSDHRPRHRHHEDGTITVREGGDAKSDRRAANCGWSASSSATQLQKDGSSLFSAPEGVAAGTAPEAFASSRARSSNPTCAASSRWRA